MTVSSLPKQVKFVRATAAKVVNPPAVQSLRCLSEVDNSVVVGSLNPPLTLSLFHPFENPFSEPVDVCYEIPDSENDSVTSVKTSPQRLRSNAVGSNVSGSSVSGSSVSRDSDLGGRNSGSKPARAKVSGSRMSGSNVSDSKVSDSKVSDIRASNSPTVTVTKSVFSELNQLLDDIESLSQGHVGNVASNVASNVNKETTNVSAMTSTLGTISALINDIEKPNSSSTFNKSTVKNITSNNLSQTSSQSSYARDSSIAGGASVPKTLTSLTANYFGEVAGTEKYEPGLRKRVAQTAAYSPSTSAKTSNLVQTVSPNTGEQLGHSNVIQSHQQKQPIQNQLSQPSLQKKKNDSSQRSGLNFDTAKTNGFLEKGFLEKGQLEQGQLEQGQLEQGQLEQGLLNTNLLNKGLIERDLIGRSPSSLRQLEPSETLKVADALSDYLQEQASLHGVDLS